MGGQSFKSYQAWFVYLGSMFGLCGLANDYLASLSPANLMILGMVTLVASGSLARRMDSLNVNAKAVVRIIAARCSGWPSDRKSFLNVAPALTAMTGAERVSLHNDVINIDDWSISRRRFYEIAKELNIF